jgi:hypothetical protein
MVIEARCVNADVLYAIQTDEDNTKARADSKALREIEIDVFDRLNHLVADTDVFNDFCVEQDKTQNSVRGWIELTEETIPPNCSAQDRELFLAFIEQRGEMFDNAQLSNILKYEMKLKAAKKIREAMFEPFSRSRFISEEVSKQILNIPASYTQLRFEIITKAVLSEFIKAGLVVYNLQ